jgi:hypothetical protein
MQDRESPKRLELTDGEIYAAESACEAVDAQDYSRLREIFAGDVIFARPTDPSNPIHGVENVIANFQSRPRNRLTQHFVMNIRVCVESPTTASGSCRILLYMSDASEPETVEGRQAVPKQIIGVYQDRYLCTNDGWRIAERLGKTVFRT